MAKASNPTAVDAAKNVLTETAAVIVDRYNRRGNINPQDALLLLGCVFVGVQVPAPTTPAQEEPAAPAEEPEA